VVMSIVTTAVCVGCSTLALTLPSGGVFIGAMLPMGVLVGCALYTIRGYDVTSKHIAIKRLLWSTYLSRHDIGKASVVDIDRRGWRIAGNGGAFAYSGVFSSPQFGRYRAYMTGPKRGVLLEYPNRKVVLTPDDPERFVRKLGQ
jgi:hypothetical protein